MKEFLSLAGRVAIIAFFLWHTFAVAIYATPREAKDPIGKWALLDVLPIVTPYMLQTSQWQLWNIFSPDPLRRVTFFHIEENTNGEWKEVEVIKDGSYSIWRHATQFKMLSNMLDEFAENREALVGRFLQLKCNDFRLGSGTPIRLSYEYYVIPYHEKRESLAWWQAWKPESVTYPGYQTTCP